jgi:short-subunit dehydrogenase
MRRSAERERAQTVNVLITGASSGIGEAVAIECAKRGDTLFLCGRNPERTGKVASACKAAGAKEVYAETVDVSDGEAMRKWLGKCDSLAPLERIFANAGIGTGTESEENVRRTFSVNVNGCLNTVLPAIELFRARRKVDSDAKMQILITASIAGYSPLASCPSYSATKSCMKTWALAMRGMLKKENISVSAICPGFVRSRITDCNTCPMPFFMEADKAAKIILDGADRNVGLIAFPWQMRFGVWLLSVLPFRVNEFVNRFIPAKVGERK